jgi:peptidoglycan hydrolase-like protein with peptidoglycan-binding domain
VRRLGIWGCALLIATTLAQASTEPTKITTSSTSHHHHRILHRKSHRAGRHGQQKIDSQRALQIQQALIREHYLTGKPSGVWDSATQTAMQKYQADNGWQSKTTPDSRALIKLGLGPDQEHLLNPESAMTSQPQPHNAHAPAASNSTDLLNSAQPQK